MRAKYSLMIATVLFVFLPCASMGGEFFDDFDDNNIDDWEEAGDGVGVIEVVDGQVHMEATAARTMLLAPEEISAKLAISTPFSTPTRFRHSLTIGC